MQVEIWHQRRPLGGAKSETQRLLKVYERFEDARSKDLKGFLQRIEKAKWEAGFHANQILVVSLATTPLPSLLTPSNPSAQYTSAGISQVTDKANWAYMSSPNPIFFPSFLPKMLSIVPTDLS